MIRRPFAYVFALTISVCAQGATLGSRSVEVVVEGLENELRTNVLRRLSIEQQSRAALTEGRLRVLHERAAAEIRAALEPFGHYRVQIDSRLEHEDGRWTAHYSIDPGSALPVTVLDLNVLGDGREDPAFTGLFTEFPLRLGEALVHARYEDGKRALLRLAAERGYFDARLARHDVRIDLDAYTASVTLHLDSGPRYRFGSVEFEQDYFDKSFLARFVSFERGSPFSNTAVLQLQVALGDSDYFEHVEVIPRRDLAQGLEIPIQVKLRLRPPNKYTFGAGYGSDAGARGKLGWERRLINPTGHRFGTELDVSEIRTALAAQYRVPVSDPRTDQVIFNTALSEDRPLTSRSRTAAFGAALKRARGPLHETLSLNYQRETFSTAGDTGRTSLLIPGANWVHTDSDKRLYPHRGRRAQLDVRGASDALASDVSFWQVRVAGKIIHPVGKSRLIIRADAGYTRVSVFDDLPASLRFYAGGSQSVRGYSYQSLGPVDETGAVVGGRYLLVGSLEYEQQLFESWGAAVFYDVGKAYNDASERFNEGAGIGARWRLPIGVARLDFARALSRAGRPWRVHFSIGLDL